MAAIIGDGFEHDFRMPDGTTLPRLRKASTDSERNAASNIPTMIEKPHHHFTPGGHVLYLDGHVEFLKLGSGFPMTEEFLSALDSIDE